MIKKKKVRVKDSEKGFSDNNDLFSYLDAAMEASRKSYEGHRDNLKCLFNVDSLFVDLIPYATKIKPSTSAVLLLNTHSVYRSAIQLSLSGQNIPVFMALRGAIESALYANAMVMKPELEHIWLNRSKDEKSRSICRSEFQFGKVIKYLEESQDREFSLSVKDAYQNTIDFGAHPNSRLLSSNVNLEELGDGNTVLQFAYIHSANSFELKQSLIACAEIGLTIFFILLIASGERDGLKELNRKALDVHDAIPGMINDLGLEN